MFHMKRQGFFRHARNKFVAGLLILIPIVITVQALWWLFNFVDEMAQPLAIRIVGRAIPGIGFALTVTILFLTGLLFSTGPLRRLLDGLEDVVEHIPLVGVIYTTIKKVFEGFGSMRNSDAFKRFVFARLRGRTTPGFLTGTFELQRNDGTTTTFCMVYVPTNHLYVGDVVAVEAENVIETDLSVEDGISLILSAGSALPEKIREVAARD